MVEQVIEEAAKKNFNQKIGKFSEVAKRLMSSDTIVIKEVIDLGKLIKLHKKKTPILKRYHTNYTV